MGLCYWTQHIPADISYLLQIHATGKFVASLIYLRPTRKTDMVYLTAIFKFKPNGGKPNENASLKNLIVNVPSFGPEKAVRVIEKKHRIEN